MDKKKYDLISISPYNFLDKWDGASNRIRYLNKKLCEAKKVLTVIRDEWNIKYHVQQGDILLWSKNKFLHLLSPLVLKKIFLEKSKNKNITLYCYTIWSWMYALFCYFFFWLNYHFDDQNVEYIRFKRSWSKARPIIKIYEKMIIKYSQSVSFVSRHDSNFVDKNLIEHNNVSIITNDFWVNIDKINKKLEIRQSIRQKHSIDKWEKLLLFFWSFGYEPNISALKVIQKTINPWLISHWFKYKFVICGKWLDSYIRSDQNMIYAWFVDDIVDYILASDMMVAPMVSGSGTQLKIIESLSYWLPVCTTGLWAEWLDIHPHLYSTDLEDMNDFIVWYNYDTHNQKNS